jgi:threonine/homoserine/homoserine lactone efflux protein
MIPSHSSLILFISAALVLLVIPGAAVFYILGRSIGQGALPPVENGFTR